MYVTSGKLHKIRDFCDYRVAVSALFATLYGLRGYPFTLIYRYVTYVTM